MMYPRVIRKGRCIFLVWIKDEVEVVSMHELLLRWHKWSIGMSLAKPLKDILGQDATTFDMHTWHEQQAICH